MAGLSQQVALDMPFLLAGGIRALYDLVLWAWFRRVAMAEPEAASGSPEEEDR
jgi:hypothetical protein